MIKLTQKHFDLFRKTCKIYLDKLGLHSWRVEYRFKSLEKDRGQCRSDYKGRIAVLSLSSEFDNDYKTDLSLNEMVILTAKHECLELLFSVLCVLAVERTWSEIDWDKEMHIVIRTLEKIV